MDKKIRMLPLTEIHCACVIHGTAYSWEYVEKLYNSLQRNLTPKVVMHVYTEKTRKVPDGMIKHNLDIWDGIDGPKKAWWYKIQLFNDRHYSGQMLYFDLDTVIVKNIDWVWQLNSEYFWAVKDFKYLFNERKVTINSSVMWFNVSKFKYVYDNFSLTVCKNLHGDQDYIHIAIPSIERKYLDSDKIKSFRWEVLDGGFNFKTRKHSNPGVGPILSAETDIIVFHGKPKPHEISNRLLADHW